MPFYLAELVTFGGAAAQRLGVDDDQGARPRAVAAARAPSVSAAASHAGAAVISVALIVALVIDIIVDTSSSPGPKPPGPKPPKPPPSRSMKASSRWASKESPPPVAIPVPVPGGLPAPLGLGFEAGCHPGELHLVAEEPAPDAPVFVLPPPKVSVGVDPGPPQPLVLLAAAGRPLLGGGVAQLLVRGPLVEQLQEVSAGLGGLAQRGGHDLELIGRELPVVQGLGQVRVLGGPRRRGQTSLRRPGRGARERPEPLSRRSVASLGVLPALDHLGREEGHPRGRQPLGLAEQGDELAGRSARQRDRDRTPHDVTDEPDRLLDIGHQDRLGGRWRFGWECR